MKPYDPSKIESKWQKAWARERIYRTVDPVGPGRSREKASDKFYILDMFPYPSGEGLHVGHPKGYIATDVISRMKRMQGKSVLHPMGFDAFGLPAENYAIKTKTNPQVSVGKNVARYKKQLEILGLDYDWSREVNTTDPKFYRWTQWIFLQLFKKGLAYESFEPINWCPSCKTGLANEDIEDGRCERCGTPVEKKPLRQWVLRITDYADRLLADLDAEDYDMPKLIDKVNPHQPGKPMVRRSVAHAIVYDPAAKKYLIIRNKKHGWDTVVIGGIEGSESAVETARREVREETGYTDLEFKRVLGGPTEAQYYTKHKGENRIAIAQAVYFELKSHAKVALADGEDADNEILWVDAAHFVPGTMVNSELPIWLERLKDPSKGWPKKLLDWPSSIKESQRNWIGRSEGALLQFEIAGSGREKGAAPRHIDVYTTRPDTLFGVTYVVLAPEHALVAELSARASNKAQIEAYVAAAKAAPETERTDAKKDKTGVELKGVRAVNPATGQEVPVWIADYVLADYGTGAVMAVPAHDERDWAFARKFGLPTKEVVVPDFIDATAGGSPRGDKKTSNRKSVTVLVKHWSEDKYILLEWKKTPRTTFITGGIEAGEDPVAASIREIREETGYTDAAFVRHLGRAYGHFYAAWKEENHQTHIDGLLFQLKSGAREEVDAAELAKHEPVWVAAQDIERMLKKTEHDIRFSLYFWANMSGRASFTGEGRLVDSGAFDGQESSAAKRAIAESVGGRWTAKYKLRDWVFSRQRYWGEPIPVVHCERCAFARYQKEARLSLNFYYDKVWKALADGSKTLETRALNPEEKGRYFGDIKAGDVLHFCYRDKETKKLKEDRLFRVTSAKTYRSFDELFADKEALAKLARKGCASARELEASYAAYGAEYVEKIRKNGLVAWAIEPVTVSVAVPEKDLPVLLPKVKSYEPTGTGESPLAAISEWVNTKCPVCKKPAKRETNTMPQWAGSSWYYLRYMDPKNAAALVDPKKERAWSPVDLYVGGAEHATRHLIYARFWHKFLYDIGAVSSIEPFAKLQSVGLIMGEDGRKMSKRFGNVVNPDDIVKSFGADTLRVYEMFMGPFDQQIAWSTAGMVGSRRFIERVWKLAEKIGKEGDEKGKKGTEAKDAPRSAAAGNKAVDRIIHKAIEKVGEDVAEMKFNTAISALMIAANELEKAPALTRGQFEAFIKLLAPFAPHATEELWRGLGNKKSIHISDWPAHDPSLVADEEATVIVQVDGKVRGSFSAPKGAANEDLERAARALPAAAKWLEGKKVAKAVVVPGKLVNFVLAK